MIRTLFFALILAAAIFAQTGLRAAPKEEAGAMPKVGDLAPDFKLQYFDGQLKEVSLSEYRGQKQVVLAFYVFAFTGG